MPITLVRKQRQDSDSPLVQAAVKLEGRTAKTFVDSINQIRSEITPEMIQEALSKPDPNAALISLNVDEKFHSVLNTHFKEMIHELFLLGADTAKDELNSKIELSKSDYWITKAVTVTASFDLTNQNSIAALQAYTFNLITGLTAESKEAIRQVIVRAFQEGGSPAEQARMIRDVIGLTPTQEKAIANYRSALEGGSTSELQDALSRSLRDGRYDPSLLSAMQSGVSLSQDKIDAMVGRYSQRFLAYRATAIARTETIRASMVGQDALWQQAVENGHLPDNVLRRWVTSLDNRACPVCRDLDGETAELGEEFLPDIERPPAHPSCRCSLVIELPDGNEAEDAA